MKKKFGREFGQYIQAREIGRAKNSRQNLKHRKIYILL